MSAIAVGHTLQERGSTQLSGAGHTIASPVVSQSVSAAIIRLVQHRYCQWYHEAPGPDCPKVEPVVGRQHLQAEHQHEGAIVSSAW